MPQINRTALVPYSAQQMFELVNDVNAYPEFLPGCVSSQILEQSDAHMTASLDVAKAGVRKTFVTHNVLQEFNQIEMRLVDGPFKKLVGGWKFIELDAQACKIELVLDFEFKNSVVELAFGRVFKELTNSMVQAFTKRAKEVYEF
uniref:SRPBCC family protein n=1 Tax=Thaumasiovibrio occultus TaxID=1891184 RepID=UPI000B34C50F|nr:SRPBCC family protein [Thaumasiovibrio occultus]